LDVYKFAKVKGYVTMQKQHFKREENVPRPIAEAEGCRTRNIMKRICIILLFIFLASCNSIQTTRPTRVPGELSLEMPSECLPMSEGLCLVSEPGEWLGEGKTTIITQKPVAAFIGASTALQIKVGEWTLILDPGENTPFSVGMAFPNAKLYPQGKNVGMTVERDGKKCDEVEGTFIDDTLQSAQKGDLNANPVSFFDIRFTMRCNKQPQVILGRVKLAP
jgi:hypothetical protein